MGSTHVCSYDSTFRIVGLSRADRLRPSGKLDRLPRAWPILHSHRPHASRTQGQKIVQSFQDLGFGARFFIDRHRSNTCCSQKGVQPSTLASRGSAPNSINSFINGKSAVLQASKSGVAPIMFSSAFPGVRRFVSWRFGLAPIETICLTKARLLTRPEPRGGGSPSIPSPLLGFLTQLMTCNGKNLRVDHSDQLLAKSIARPIQNAHSPPRAPRLEYCWPHFVHRRPAPS